MGMDAAHRSVSCECVLRDIFDGKYYSCGANQTHGLLSLSRRISSWIDIPYASQITYEDVVYVRIVTHSLARARDSFASPASPGVCRR